MTALIDCKLFLDGYNLSEESNEFNVASEVNLLNNTRFGDHTERNAAGLVKAAVSVGGFFSAKGTGDNAQSDDVLSSFFGLADKVFTACPLTGVDGEIAYFLKFLEGEYHHGGKVGDSHLFGMSGKASHGSGLVRGTVMKHGAVNTDGNGTAYELGAVGATKKVYVGVHYYVISDFTEDDQLILYLESDDNESFTSATQRAQITVCDGTGAYRGGWVSAVGPITDTWWRVRWAETVTGDPTFTFIASVGIK